MFMFFLCFVTEAPFVEHPCSGKQKGAKTFFFSPFQQSFLFIGFIFSVKMPEIK